MNKDGGPAFPHMAKAHYQGAGGLITEQITESGMSLRDYFAAHATENDISQYLPSAIGDIANLLSSLGRIDKPENQRASGSYAHHDYACLRAWAKYKYADDMIAERSK